MSIIHNSRINSQKQETKIGFTSLGLGLEDKDIKMIKDDNKRIHEIEKQLRMMQSSTVMDNILDQINNLKELVNSKTGHHDFADQNEKISNN
jgi:hypothetical protein